MGGRWSVISGRSSFVVRRFLVLGSWFCGSVVLGGAYHASRAALPNDLLSRVRGSTEGKRSVFVSHRRDPELQAALQETFGFASLECKIVEPRRLQALGEAIEEGTYDLVIAATGFQLGSLDQLLARACRTAGVTYLRVNRGRPLACLRALARDLDARLGS